MKPIDLSKLNLRRLESYRKSLIPKRARFEHCNDCGEKWCEYRIKELEDNEEYLALRNESIRVNKEINKRV